jgi:polyhydroxybutyrate depolymerase
MTAKPTLMLLLGASLVWTAGCRVRPGSHVEPDPAQHTIRVGGRERTYVVRVPSTIAREAGSVPLVIVLHGGGGNARNAETMTGFTAKGEAERFIVAYPNGTSRRAPLLTWNAGHCCGYAMEERVDDVAFIRALIDDLSARHRIDQRRIYVTGMSNGAMMSHRLGIELSDRIAAIAPVVGTVFGDETRPRSRVSAIMVNGMRDDFVPYRGGPPGGRFQQAWDGTPTRPALDQARFWASANGCDATLRTEDRGAYLIGRHECVSPVAVEIYSVKDNGHAWPGGRTGSRRADTPSTALNATDVIWAFFRAHPKP